MRDVRRTKNEDIGRLASRWFATSRCSSRLTAASDGRRGFQVARHTRAFSISGVATKRKKCTSGFYGSRGCLQQVGVFIAAAGTLGRRRAVGATIAASGTTRGPGQSIAWPSLACGLGLFDPSPLVSTAVPVIIAIGSRVGGSRAALGVIRHVTLLANAWHEDRSFEPSNDALQPTSGAVAIGVNRSGVQAPLAAERERYTDEQDEELQIILLPGCREFLAFTAALVLLHAAG